jgi:hypothetical protein
MPTQIASVVPNKTKRLPAELRPAVPGSGRFVCKPFLASFLGLLPLCRWYIRNDYQVR